MPFTESAIADKRAKHGELFQRDDGQNPPRWEVVVRAPSRGDYKRFRLTAEKDRVSAIETLVNACVVLPEAAELDAIFDRFPVAIDVIAGELIEIAGGTEKPGKKAL